MRSVRVALAVGLVALVAVLVVVLSQSRLSVAGSNSVAAQHELTSLPGGSKGCEEAGTLPAGTTAIRVSLGANVGPTVNLQALSGPVVVAQGKRGAGWGFAASTTVPVKRVSQTINTDRVCVALGADSYRIIFYGSSGYVTTVTGQRGVARRFRVEYLRPGHRSWWSLASYVAHRMGFGHAPSGTWVVYLLIALMITIATLASRLILRELQ